MKGKPMRRFLATTFWCLAASSALAEPARIECQGETIIIPGWDTGTMNVTYDGGASGTLTVKGPHTDFNVPASSHTYEKPYPPVVIDGAGDIKAVMPDLKAIDTCVAGRMKSNPDPSLYSMFAISCMEKGPASAAPVPVHATATITFLRNDDSGALEPFVSMKLIYIDKLPSQTDNLSIEFMTKGCKSIP